MENDINKAMEDTLVRGPGRVKRGLIWLGSEQAKEMGLSLDRLIERALVSPHESKRFDLAFAQTCAIGYASEHPSYVSGLFSNVCEDCGTAWMKDHGFLLGGNGVTLKVYDALTQEWRSQLQALTEERGQA